MRRILAILALLFACSAAVAQQPPAAERGLKPDLAYDFNGFDTVNLFNGGLLATVPLGGTYPVGAGLSYSFSLHYSGNVWEEEEVCKFAGQPCVTRYFPQRDNGGMGWRLSFGRLYEPGGTTAGTAASMWRYESPDGGEHFFYDTLHDPPCSSTVTTNCDSVVTGTRYTRDGSFLRMKDPATNVRVIEFGTGERHRYVEYTTDKWRLEYVYSTFSTLDVNGIPTSNFIRFEYIPNAQAIDDWKITDSHGRTHWVRFQPPASTTSTANLVDKVELSAFNGAVATYDLSYVTSSIKRPCENTDSIASATVGFLTSVALPSGEAWTFQYEQPTVSCSNTSGTMTQAVLPTRGRIEWAYQRYTYASTGYDSIGVQQRRTYDLAGTQTSQMGYSTVLGSTTVTVHALRTSDNSWQPDWKTINYFDDSSGSTFGLPFLATPRSGPVPNPDGSTVGRSLSTETFDCDPATGTCATTADRATYIKHEMDAVTGCMVNNPCNRDRNRRVSATRTLFVSDSGRYADVESFDYDGLGHYRLNKTAGNFGRADVKESYTDYNGNTRNWSPGTWSGLSVGSYALTTSGTRQTGYTMLAATDAWVLNTAPSSYVLESGVQAKTYTCYDPRTGFLHRSRALSGSSFGANDLLSVFTPATAGQVAREEYFGGDKQTLSTSALCTMPLPAHDQYSYRVDHTYSYGVSATSQWISAAGAALPFYSLRQDIDFSTGLVKRSYDTAGVALDYTYDTSRRLTYVSPPYTGISRRGPTSHAYTNASGTTPAKVETRQWLEGGAFDLTLSTIEFDGFGRVWKERSYLPNGANSTRETTYDRAGRKATVSEWMNLSSPTNKTTYTYDLYGRPTRIVPPDGSGHETTVSYTGVRSLTRNFYVATSKDGFGNPVESLQSRTETYDRQGRLWTVTERPDGPATTGTSTEYTYDWGNHLTKVCLNGSGVSCGQVRLFNFDRRGLLTSEQHPEKGLNGNGSISYTYDARGNVVRKQEGPLYGTFDLTQTYDRASRLIEVRQTPDPAAPVTKILKELTYDSALGSGAGKVYEAKRHNHDRLGSDVVVTETYSYQARDGAASRRVTCVGSAGCTLTTDKKFTVLFGYDDLMLPSTVTYPDCTAPAGCASSDSSYARTINYSYANAMLTSVSQSGINYASSITYHDNAALNTVTYGNGMKTVEARDPNYMNRPASILAQLGTNPAIWSTGTYLYDGSNNVKKAGNDSYIYDGLSRIKEGTVDYVSATNQRKHRFAYDVYGNQTNKYTSVNGGAETDNNWFIAAATNRMSSPWPAQYDDAGNMSVWNNGSNTYTFDGLGALRTSTTSTGTRQYFYTADGERIWTQNTTANSGRWSLRDLQGRVLREYATTGPVNFEGFSFAKDYIYRGDAVLASVTPSATFYFHLDHLGNTRLITNAAGAEVSRHKYFPFGEEVSIYAATAEARKFTGHEREYNGGTSFENVEYLDYMHARYYSPVWGRFLSFDPVGGNPENPQSWNRNAYVLNNPLKLTDPLGLFECNARGECKDEITVTAAMPPYDWSGFASFLSFGEFLRSLSGLNYLQEHGRNPDYLAVNVNVAIPNPYTLTAAGLSFQIAVDNYGNLYWSPIGVGAGKSLTGVSGAVKAGWLLQPDTPQETQMVNYMTGHSINVGGGSYFGGALNFVPGQPTVTALELGLYTPQVGASYNYTFGPVTPPAATNGNR